MPKSKRQTTNVPPPKSGRARTKASKPAPTLSKLDAMVVALRKPKGATILDLINVTGWQVHSVRGAIAGALKKRRNLQITSTKTDGKRVYRITGRS